MRTSTREPGIIIEGRARQSHVSRRTHGMKAPPRLDKRIVYNYCLHRSKVIASPIIYTQIRTHVRICFVFTFNGL